VPVLALVPHRGSAVDESALLQHLAGRLARFKLPRRVVVLSSLPLTALGKVQRSVLSRQLARV
jgi:acyl-CoA synthetase (AMP-forming)/AMP-acid ligase II